MLRIKYFFRILFLSFVLQLGVVDSCIFKSAGENAAIEFRRGLENSGNDVRRGLENSAYDVRRGVENSAHDLRRGVENSAIELRRGAENSAKEITKGLNEATRTLTRSIDHGVDVGAQVVREISHNVTNLLKNIDVRIDSGDLAHVGADAAKSLQIAMSDLSKNWQLAIKSEDLKSIGAEAFGHLSHALQNLNAKIHFHVSIDDNVTKATLYISVAIGIAFSVCFIAILISLKSCRKCFMNVVKSLQSCTCNCCVKMENSQSGTEAAKPKLENVEANNLDCQKPFLSTDAPKGKWKREKNINGEGPRPKDTRKSVAEMKGQGYEGVAPLVNIFDKNQHNYNSNITSAAAEYITTEVAQTRVFREF